MIVVLMILGLAAAPVSAQSVDPQSSSDLPPVTKTLSLAGPRFGLTMLNDQIIAKLKERNIDVGSAISQFGWQFERAFYSKADGPTVLNEWVVLVGGLDQSVVIPSVSWLVGIRTKEGAEFGIGPNVTPGGVALAVAAGVTFRAGVINVPMNFAVVPSKYGTRVSVLMGLMRRH
jgi:hypothetical protein